MFARRREIQMVPARTRGEFDLARDRHSGAPRSGEPGIQQLRMKIWIPGSGLRPAPE
jgi:hypothetical protein